MPYCSSISSAVFEKTAIASSEKFDATAEDYSIAACYHFIDINKKVTACISGRERTRG